MFLYLGNKLQILQKQAIKTVNNKEKRVTENDVISTILEIGKSDVETGYTIIDIIPDIFELDSGEMVKEPIVNKSSKITLYAHAIIAKKLYISELKKVLMDIHLKYLLKKISTVKKEKKKKIF